MIVVDIKVVDDSGLVTSHQIKTVESSLHWDIKHAFEQLGDELATKIHPDGG